LHAKGSSLTHPTACWWCGERVFFYRNENGGCALFDALGRPWPIHGCWLEHTKRSEIEASVKAELANRGYQGTFAKPIGKRVSRPKGTHYGISLVGYVADNGALYDGSPAIQLRGHRRASTTDLAKVIVWHDDLLFPFLMPQNIAAELPDYSPIEIHGKWCKRGSRWYLLTESFRRLRGRASRYETRMPQLQDQCGVCSQALKDNWGLTDDGDRECSTCGEMRGARRRRDFLRHMRRISEQLDR
jgi:hypothetical protein